MKAEVKGHWRREKEVDYVVKINDKQQRRRQNGIKGAEVEGR